MNNLTLEKICCIQCKDLWQIPDRCIGYDASIKLNSPCMIILSRSAKTRKEMQLCKLYNLVNNIHIVLNYFHKKCLDISDLIFGIFLLHIVTIHFCAEAVEVMCKGMSGTCTYHAERYSSVTTYT